MKSQREMFKILHRSRLNASTKLRIGLQQAQFSDVFKIGLMQAIVQWGRAADNSSQDNSSQTTRRKI